MLLHSPSVLQKDPEFAFFTKNTKPNKNAASVSQLALYKLTTLQFTIQRLSKILEIPYDQWFVSVASFFCVKWCYKTAIYWFYCEKKVKIMVFRLTFGELTT